MALLSHATPFVNPYTSLNLQDLRGGGPRGRVVWRAAALQETLSRPTGQPGTLWVSPCRAGKGYFGEVEPPQTPPPRKSCHLSVLTFGAVLLDESSCIAADRGCDAAEIANVADSIRSRRPGAAAGRRSVEVEIQLTAAGENP